MSEIRLVIEVFENDDVISNFCCVPKDPLYYSENETFKDSDRRPSEWLSFGCRFTQR